MVYPTVAIQVDSDKALAYLMNLERTAQRWGRSRTYVRSSLIYAHGIETGRHWGGSMARKAGGAHMMQKGLEDSAPRIAPLIEDSFERGPSAVPLAEANIGRMVVAAAQRHTPVVSGALRGSFRYGVA